MRFKVYIDSTAESIPRVFYVGKGNASRVGDMKRNRLHTSISEKYGVTRSVVLETDDEEEAFDRERELIVEHKTCVYVEGSWGANFTLGGEGPSGMKHSDESKQKNSESNRIAQAGERNAMFGKHHSEATRKKIGDNQRGWHHTEEAKRKLAEVTRQRNLGSTRSLETRKKISESRKGRSPWNKDKKIGPYETKRVFSEQARKNISEGCKGRVPWNKGKRSIEAESDDVIEVELATDAATHQVS